MTESIADRYSNAKKIIEGNLSKNLVINDCLFPHWIDDSDSFWYQRNRVDGKEYRLVDAKAASNKVGFDHEMLALQLGALVGHAINPRNLPIQIKDWTLSPHQIKFSYAEKLWMFDAQKAKCIEINTDSELNGVVSPDGKKIAFVRDFNLWIKFISNNREFAVTHDGCCGYAYATAPDSNGQPNMLVQAVWSPDSRRVLTHRLDLRGVATRRALFPIPDNAGIRPDLFEYKLAYPGDETIESYEFVSIEIETCYTREAIYRPVPLCRGGFRGCLSGKQIDDGLGWWSSDSRIAYFLDIERDAKTVRLIQFDTDSGETLSLLEETSNTFVRLCHSLDDSPLLLPLPDTNEFIWFSERDGWGHLYLYDLKTGKEKNRITDVKTFTNGNDGWIVRDILHFDTERRELLIQTAGRDSTISPYYQDICRVNIDTGELAPLIEGPYEHIVFVSHRPQMLIAVAYGLDVPGINGVSPSGNYLVTTRSRVDMLPVSLLLDREGNEILELEAAQDVGLPEDWCWPESVTVKSVDGETDLYGVMYRPPGFSAEKTYPVLDYSLAIPYSSLLPQGSFITDTHCGDSYLMGAAFAALGFIVVALDLPGMPYRGKAFQDRCYGSMSSVNAFEDRVSSFRQLAERYPYMDLSQVGIVGCDYVTGAVYGLLDYPEFYKVGVMSAFDDPRFGIPSIVEVYEGATPPDRPYTDDQLTALKGKLLLIHGLRDVFAPPETTLQLADALQKANKDFDMILEPEGIHIVSSYALRRTWDYLVTHLLKMEPPESFTVTTAYDRVFSQASVGGEKDSQSEGTETLLPPEPDKQSEVES